MEQSHQRQSDWTISLLPRSDPRIQTPGVRPEISCCAGKIICISSVHEVIPWAGHVNYAASKGGVMLMMKSIAQEVAPFRIRANSIAPGAIRTPINMQAWDTDRKSTRLNSSHMSISYA